MKFNFLVTNGGSYMASGVNNVHVIGSSGGEIVLQNGTCLGGASIYDGCVIDVGAGANIESGLQISGGTAEISGSVDALTISGGTAVIHSGAKVVAGVVSGGSFSAGAPLLKGTLQYDSGSVLDENQTISAGVGGVAIIENGATAYNIVADGSGAEGGSAGTVILNGSASNNITVQSGGVVSVGAGTRTGNISYNEGGSVYIRNGASIIEQTVLVSGGDATHSGYMEIDKGGFISGVSAADYGSININNGSATDVWVDSNSDVTYSHSGKSHTARATNGGEIHISGGGKVDILYASSAAVVDLKSGGKVGLMSAYLGATALISSGGYASNLHVLHNGHGTIQSGASVHKLTVGSGGSVTFLSGASADSIVVSHGGYLTGPVITDKQTLGVASGGTVIGATITAGQKDSTPNPDGGKEHPLFVDNTGGVTSAASGAELDDITIAGGNGVDNVGGLLVVDSGAVIQNISMGSNSRIRFNGLHYDDQHKYLTLIDNELYIYDGEIGSPGTQATAISLSGDYKESDFSLVDDGHGTSVLVYACFLPGTMIRLENGETAIEDIKEGDALCVLENGRQQIRKVTSVMHKRATVRKDQPVEIAGWPVQVCKDAFAPGVPSQDLYVTPEHCFYLNERFVPVRMLVNGATIRYDLSQESYDYYHVRTEPHAIIWANNSLTESYLDTGKRQTIEVQDDNTARLVPFKPLTWADDSAAPLEVSRDFVEPLYNQLRDRAFSLGYVVTNSDLEKQSMTEDSDLRLMLDDGVIIGKTREHNGKMIFAIPHKTKNVRLLSRTFRPSSTIGPFLDDRRELGVLIGKIEFWVGASEIDVISHLEQESLSGWSVIESGPHRWTMGNALLPLPDSNVAEGQKRVLAIQVEAGGPYLIDESLDRAFAIQAAE